MASSISDNGIPISRQAVWKKMTIECKKFFEQVLSEVISKKIEPSEIKKQITKLGYKRVLLQDSTIIKLPKRLFESFSGVSNGHSKVCSARIQATYDVISGKFTEFSIDPYSKNDLKAAPETQFQQGDLVLRDRGYLTNNEIQRHISNEADCIYRYKYRTILLDVKTGKILDIFALLKKRKTLDMLVKLNNKERTIIRIVAVPASAEVANIRRMKAKKENKSTPTKEYLDSLSWTIFITTIPKDKADFKKLFDLYSLRWRIEIIFKSWKSNLNFDKIHNVSEIQLKVLLMARFIIIVIYTQFIYHKCKLIIKKAYDKDLSLLKVLKYLNRNPQRAVDIIEQISTMHISKPIEALAKYCSYDKRKRKNFEQLMYETFA